MEEGWWNLDDKRFNHIPVIQIAYDASQISEEESDAKNRLLLLSHHIAAHGTPAIFKEKPPFLSPNQDVGRCVLVFDIMQPFDTFELPFWATVSENWIVSATDTINTEFLEDLQQAFALILAYKYAEYDPLYFTNFILIPSTPVISLPVICEMVPVIREGSFMIRNIVQGDLKMSINYPGELKKDDIILVPPQAYPFIITSVTFGHIHTRNISGYNQSFATKELKNFVLLCNEDVLENIYNLKARDTYRNGIIPEHVSATRSNYRIDQKAKAFFKFESKEFFDFHKDDVNDSIYSQMGFGDDDDDDKFVFKPRDFSAMIDEEVVDTKLNEIIKHVMGNEPMFPVRFTYFELTLSSFVSFFNFDLACTQIQQPQYTKMFRTETPIRGRHTGIPDALVNIDGTNCAIPANTVMEAWETQRVFPISKEKTAPYVVFYFDTIEKDDVMDFFEALRASFVDHEFGDIKPFHQDDAYMDVTRENFDSYIREFFRINNLSEFQQTPILTYIVCPRGFTKVPDVHSVCTLVPEDMVRACEVSDIDHAAFITYSRIRRFDPEVYGGIDIMPPDSWLASLWYRYQGPYMIKRHDESKRAVTFHICWDPASYMTSWIDDIGSVSHIFKGTSLEIVRKQIEKLTELFQIPHKRVTICVLGESLSKFIVDDIVNVFRDFSGEFSLFGVYPMANIQASFAEFFEDDIVVFSDPEQTFFNGLKECQVPDSTCYVLSPGHTAYSISHYYNNTGEDPSLHLEGYARTMSHLSWLAVRCHDNKRISSFPPHVASILPKKLIETISVSKFEFLSSESRSHAH